MKQNMISQFDIRKTEGAYHIELDLPGCRKEELQLKMEGAKLTVRRVKINESDRYDRAEWSGDEFEKTFALEEKFDMHSIAAEFENGVLRLTLPLKEQSQPFTISIN